jgi:uncharacterized membrane protein YdfJ with MMPL/SSD domain
MLASAGKTILVSGTTLTLCFVGLCFFDLVLLKTLGAACSCSIATIMLVNLSVTPVLILTFPGFFAKVRAPRVPHVHVLLACCHLCFSHRCDCCWWRR